MFNKNITTVYSRIGIMETVEDFSNVSVEVMSYTDNLTVEIKGRNFMGNVKFLLKKEYLDEIKVYKNGKRILKRKG